MDYKTHIAGVFDRNAAQYGNFGLHYFEIFAERLLKFAPVSLGASVLDVATGRGGILKRVLSQIGKEGKAVGIDLSPQMILETGKELKAENVSLRCMDAEKLEFAEGIFDMIYCGFGLFFFPNPKQALLEFKRVLKPGGKIALSTWGKIGIPRFAFQQKIASFGLEPRTTAIVMPTRDELQELVLGAGFNSVEIVSDRLDHVYLNFDHWMEGLWHHSTRSVLEKLNQEQLVKLREGLLEELQSENRPDGFHEELNVLYTLAS